MLPAEACLEEIRRCAAEWRVPLTLATVLAREVVAGKQHPRTRIGFRAAELAELDRYLGRHGASIDRVVCRADSTRPPFSALTGTARS